MAFEISDIDIISHGCSRCLKEHPNFIRYPRSIQECIILATRIIGV